MTHDSAGAHKKSEVEIVSHSMASRLTRSEKDRAAFLATYYQDLDENQRKDRPKQEAAFTTGNNIVETHGMLLKDADDFLMIGVSSQFALAMRCTDRAVDPNLMPDPIPDDAPDRGKLYYELAKRSVENAIVQHKMDLTRIENAALRIADRRYLESQVKCKKDASDWIEVLKQRGTRDAFITQSVSTAMSDTWKKMNTNDFPDKRDNTNLKEPDKLTTTEAPGGLPEITMASLSFLSLNKEAMEYSADSVHSERKEEEEEPTNTFTLWACTVPRVNKSPKKWHPLKTPFPIVCLNDRSIPSVCFNETHLVVTYLPYIPQEKRKEWGFERSVLFSDIYQITDNKQLKRVDRKAYQFPECMLKSSSLLETHLSAHNIFTLAYGRGVIVFDATSVIKTPRVIWTTLESENVPSISKRLAISDARIIHPSETERNNTSSKKEAAFEEWVWGKHATLDHRNAPPVPEWSGVLYMSTTRGETFALCWRTGAIKLTEQTPAHEPVFSVVYRNRNMYIQTITSLSGYTATQDSRFFIHTDRPVAMDACGQLAFVLTKYGELAVRSAIQRNILRIYKPKEPADVPLLQHRYEGVVAEPERVIVLEATGRIRTYTISHNN